MSYSERTEYQIVPDNSFAVVRNCSGCKKKSRYRNTKHFRVNANGSRLDVWLIYQCEKCKHTWNLTVYERQPVNQIPKDEYRKFMDNEEALAEEYGRNSAFFMKNRAEIDWEEVSYHYVDAKGTLRRLDEMPDSCMSKYFVIDNPCGLRIRPEKLAAEVFRLSRSQIKKMTENGQLRICQEGRKTEIRLL